MGLIGLHSRKISLWAFACALFVACSERVASIDNLLMYELKPNDITEEVSDLSGYISELEVVTLSKDSIAFKSINKLLVSNRYYIVLSGGVVFSVSIEDYNLIKIGDVGRGPGEYLSIKDIAISPDNKELWCLELYNSILRYDISDGAFLGKIEIPKNIGYAKAIVPLNPDEFGLYIPNPTSGFCLNFFNSDGKDLGSALDYKQYNFDMGFSIPVTVTDGNTYAISPESKMPSVVYRNGIPEMQLRFDFGNKNVPDKFYSVNQRDPWIYLDEIFKRDYYKHVSSVYFPNDDICFRVFGEGSSSWNYYINEARTHGIRWQSKGISAPPIHPIASSGGYVFFPFEDYGYLTLEEEEDELKRIALEKYGMPEQQGMFIIKVRFDVK